MGDVNLRVGLPHTFGWLRRRELERTRQSEIWETPDGQCLPKPLGFAKTTMYAALLPDLPQAWIEAAKLEGRK